MIVRPHPAGWRITLHPAHGLLAAALYTQLRNQATPALHLPSLLAVGQHDDHQLDFSRGNYLTAGGAPQDFTLMTMDDAQRSLQAEQLLEEAYRKHAWTYLLIGKHYEFLYQGQEVDERLRTLLADLPRRRTAILEGRGWDAEELDRTYDRMRFCDRLSLILCGEEVPTMGRALEINAALGEAHFVRELPDQEQLTVRPWPFVADRFTVRSESFVLEQLTFADSQSLGATLADTTAEERSWTFGSASS